MPSQRRIIAVLDDSDQMPQFHEEPWAGEETAVEQESEMKSDSDLMVQSQGRTGGYIPGADEGMASVSDQVDSWFSEIGGIIGNPVEEKSPKDEDSSGNFGEPVACHDTPSCKHRLHKRQPGHIYALQTDVHRLPRIDYIIAQLAKTLVDWVEKYLGYALICYFKRRYDPFNAVHDVYILEHIHHPSHRRHLRKIHGCKGVLFCLSLVHRKFGYLYVFTCAQGHRPARIQRQHQRRSHICRIRIGI